MFSKCLETACWFSGGFFKTFPQILNVLRNFGWTMSTTVAFVDICHTSCLPKFGHQMLNCPSNRYIVPAKISPALSLCQKNWFCGKVPFNYFYPLKNLDPEKNWSDFRELFFVKIMRNVICCLKVRLFGHLTFSGYEKFWLNDVDHCGLCGHLPHFLSSEIWPPNVELSF